MAKELYWTERYGPAHSVVDVHAAFRLSFSTATANASLTIEHAGASWYCVYLDGAQVAEGPTRFVGAPYAASTSVTVPAAGKHVVAIHAHSCGEGTRIMLAQDAAKPFVSCAVTGGGATALSWRCLTLTAAKHSADISTTYAPQWARMSTLLGWMECATIEAGFGEWQSVGFDDSKWLKPTAVGGGMPALVALSTVAGPASSAPGPLYMLDHGFLRERFGYVNDDPPARFALRTLASAQDEPLLFANEDSGGRADAQRADAQAGRQGAPPLQPNPDYGPPQGKWWRFDALRAQLLRPVLTITAPAGTMVEVCYCQALIDGKASPKHPLCGGTGTYGNTCYMDRYTVGNSMDMKVHMDSCC